MQSCSETILTSLKRFISYSTKDQEFAERLHADLQNKGVRCWFAPHDIQSGKKLHEQIDEAIRLHDKLLLILSPDSMKSEWVKTEIAMARKREVRDQRRVLFPIRLAPFEALRDWECFDADTGKDSAREIREYFIPDFSNWKDHDSYQAAFISYSTKDQTFADRLYADLQNKGVRCWFAPHDVQGGRKLHEQIDEAIRLHDKLLLILSPHSMESEWVKTEIAKARKREVRDKRRVLFPIRLAPFETLRDWECFDADTGKDSAREIREYFIPDFSNWKDHDSYQEAFQRLISDLKASDARPPATQPTHPK